jgi:hypothetical protein
MMKPSLLSCWYPFRSKEVKEIYANLTPEEIYRLKDGTSAEGALFGVGLFVVIYFPLRFVPPHWGLIVQLAIALSIALIFGFFAGVPVRAKGKKLLCDSAYAKEKGYTPENLRLYSFG